MQTLLHRVARHLQYELRRVALRTTHRDQRYAIEGTPVVLPPEHRLPYFQAVFPSYDRYFLPILRALAADRKVLLIDVGANVGDTAVAALSAAGTIDVVAVEGNPCFVGYLRRNIAPFAPRVTVVDRFVGPLDPLATYAHNGSTGGFSTKADVPGGSTPTAAPATASGTAGTTETTGTQAPDWVEVPTLLGDESRLTIWKSDTDGYDVPLAVTNWEVLHRRCDVLWLEYDPTITQGDPAHVEELGRLLGESDRTVWFFDHVGRHMASARGPAARSLLAGLTSWIRRQRGTGAFVNYLDLWAFDENCLAGLPDPTTLP